MPPLENMKKIHATARRFKEAAAVSKELKDMTAKLEELNKEKTEVEETQNLSKVSDQFMFELIIDLLYHMLMTKQLVISLHFMHSLFIKNNVSIITMA